MLRNTRQCARYGVYHRTRLLLYSTTPRAERQSDRSGLYNWGLIDQLYNMGGIRIEDNVCVTADGVENLTST